MAVARPLLIRDIGEMLTLAGVAAKDGRHVRPEDLGLATRHAMLIDGGRIQWIGPQKKLPRNWAQKKFKEISLDGRTVLPAFVECHTHLLFGGDRRHEFEMRTQGATYQDIAKAGGGILSTMRETRLHSPAQLAKVGQSRAARFVSQGVTTLEVKTGYGLNLASEVKMLQACRRLQGPRIVPTYLAAHALPPEFRDYTAYLTHLREHDLLEVARRKLAKRVDIFIDQGYFPIEASRLYLKKARELGFDVVVHAEQLSHTGATQLALEMNAVSAEHLVQVNEDDIRALSQSQTTAVLLPASDLYLKMAYPPARSLWDQGARVALATDFNPGSSPTQDLSLIGLLARLEMKMSLAEVLVAYTYNAASALRLQHEVGSLEVGKAADWTVLDGNWDELFYQIGSHPVHQVWSQGSMLWQQPMASLRLKS